MPVCRGDETSIAPKKLLGKEPIAGKTPWCAAGRSSSRCLFSTLLCFGGCLLFVAVAGLLLGGQPAWAHAGGKAIPKVDLVSRPVSPEGSLVHEVTATIVDADSGTPVEGADVVAEATMSVPHFMQTLPWKLEPSSRPGVYIGTIRYPMPAEWKLTVRISGPGVVEATAETNVSVRLVEDASSNSSSGEGTSASPGTRASVTVSESLSRRDAVPILSLAAHAASASIWVIATLLVVLSVHPKTQRVFSESFRSRISAPRSPARVMAALGGVALVATGLLNGVVAAPFRLVPTPSSISAAAQYPYGTLYLAILGGKIAALFALVVVNRIPTASEERQASASRFALWADVVLFPVLLLLITSLRYVHVLSHVSAALR